MANTFIKNDLIPEVTLITDAMAFEMDDGAASSWASAPTARDYFSAGAVQDLLTVTSDGQTVFALTSTPVSNDAFSLYLNGQLRLRGTDYTQTGTVVTWLDPGGVILLIPDELIARYNDIGGSAGVDSFEGRTGIVVGVLNDYDASLVNNDSTVVGATVKDALETLEAGHSPVDSVFGRTGDVVSNVNDYLTSQIDNNSLVDGFTSAEAFNTLLAGTSTVTTVGTGGDFATFQLAFDALEFEVRFISDVTETVALGSTIINDLIMDMNGFTWNTGAITYSISGANRWQFIGDGQLETALTGASSATFDLESTATLDLTGFRQIDNSANTAINTSLVTHEAGTRTIVDNTDFILHDGALCGFIDLGPFSRISNVGVLGGGISCSGFITRALDITVSNISFSGTFDSAQANPTISFLIGTAGSIVSNITNSGTSFWITTQESNSRFSNIQDNVSIDLETSDDSKLTDCKLDSLDMSDVGCNSHYLKGLTVVNAVTIAGDNNRGTTNNFQAALTISGDNNNLFLTETLSITDTGTDNFVIDTLSTLAIKEVFLQATTYDGVVGDYAVKNVTMNGSANFTFSIPADFVTLVSIKLIGIPSLGAAGAGKDIDLASDYGTIGEDSNFHSETDTTTVYDLSGTQDKLTEVLDLSVVLSVLAAGDYMGILVTHNGVGGDIDYLGIKLTYTTI